MGMCIDPDQNIAGLSFEVRRESVVFYSGDFYSSNDNAAMKANSIEVSKEFLKDLKILFEDDKWGAEILPPTPAENEMADGLRPCPKCKSRHTSHSNLVDVDPYCIDCGHKEPIETWNTPRTQGLTEERERQ